MSPGNPENIDLHMDMVRNFWLRDRARQIGEKAIEIFTGESEEFGELRKMIDSVEDGGSVTRLLTARLQRILLSY